MNASHVTPSAPASASTFANAEQTVIQEAKARLMRVLHWNEADAYAALRQTAMDLRVSMAVAAMRVLQADDLELSAGGVVRKRRRAVSAKRRQRLSWAPRVGT